jgi:hypothetical protein
MTDDHIDSRFGAFEALLIPVTSYYSYSYLEEIYSQTYVSFFYPQEFPALYILDALPGRTF